MSHILASRHRVISKSEPFVSFLTDGDEHRPDWWRWLTIAGQKAYLLGNACDTCAFMFERQEGATKNLETTLSLEALQTALQEGIDDLSPEILETVGAIIPSGTYKALLLRMTAHPVQLGTPSDYFANEQVANLGVDPFWGLPHHPKVPYYRAAGSLLLGTRERLFEFVVPMFPSTWLNQERVIHYRERLSRAACPTAVALSILDVKAPSSTPLEDDAETHYCLAHYLLDGHHKTEAAAQENKPYSIISFLAVDQSVCSPAQLQAVLAALT